MNDLIKMRGNLASVEDYERHAESVLPKNVWEYYSSGAGAETTLVENKRALSRYKIRPRILRDVSKRDLSTTILGERVSLPIGISPTALQRMAHPQGELANARAAQALGTIYTLSTLATSSIEEVAEAAPKCLKWFQLYVFKDRDLTRNLVHRAEKAGFKAIVLTVDGPVFGIRLPDVRNKFTLPEHLTLKNFIQHDINSKNDGSSRLSAYIGSQLDASLNWQHVDWLKTITDLPIILKGILTVEDALLAVKAKVAGIIVSNHGGRQLDGAVASIDVLEEIVKATDFKLEVYLDGGIRNGIDVFRALALGAKMVFIGRPAIYGLAFNGEEGVENILSILKNELDNTLALTGCCKVDDIQRGMVIHEENLRSKM